MIRKTVKASGETWRYSYTIFDELARASRHASADAASPELEWKAYGYDGFGRLDIETGSAGPTATKVLYYDGQHIIAEASDANLIRTPIAAMMATISPAGIPILTRPMICWPSRRRRRPQVFITAPYPARLRIIPFTPIIKAQSAPLPT
jgi:hypothetical protein